MCSQSASPVLRVSAAWRFALVLLVFSISFLSCKKYTDAKFDQHERLRELTAILRELAKTEPEPPEIRAQLRQSVADYLENSGLSHNCEFGRVACRYKGSFMNYEYRELIELAGILKIEEAIPQLAQHLTTRGSMFVTAGTNTYRTANPAIKSLAKFGDMAVPLVLQNMRNELTYGDHGTEVYWYCAACYLEEVYQEETPVQIRLLASEEKDETMRERLLSIALSHAEEYVKHELPSIRRRERHRERSR